ncbi:MAG: metallophosphoesterase [Bacteroidia bacterium]
MILIFYRPHQWHDVFRIILSVILLIEISKLFGALFMLLDDVRRLFLAIFSFFNTSHKNISSSNISRSEFFSQLAILFTFIPFAGFIYGIVRGAYKFKIHQVELFFDELPSSFDGLKIVQISDLHLGSFFNTKPVEKIVELVNKEHADIIFFTGDLVNNIADEAFPYKNILSQLKAPMGVYSILGNHDYGDYVLWESESKKKENLWQLIQLQKEMGWDILLNENRILEKSGEKIAIIGVENWGGNLHFPKYGKLDIAYKGVQSIPFKILLSHDPSHWDLQVSKEFKDIQLTLSGHTHGFQFGVEYGNIKFSPVKWVYKHWAGLYKLKHKNFLAENKKDSLTKNVEQYLYVNRGVGFIGYPGRLGIWPEITVIKLKRG